jgi:hypothetical protein
VIHFDVPLRAFLWLSGAASSASDRRAHTALRIGSDLGAECGMPPSLSDVSSLTKHPIVADDRRIVLLRRLNAL